jgi:hypothetical protein
MLREMSSKLNKIKVTIKADYSEIGFWGMPFNDFKKSDSIKLILGSSKDNEKP